MKNFDHFPNKNALKLLKLIVKIALHIPDHLTGLCTTIFKPNL